MITILLSVNGSLDHVADEITRTRQRFANKRRHGVWSNWTLDAAVEVDGMHAHDWSSLLPGRKETLDTLPKVGRQSGWLWIGSIHGFLCHRGFSRYEVSAILSEMWPGVRRVNVDPVWSADLNAGSDDVWIDAASIVSYGLKHSETTQLSHQKVDWPVEMQAVWWSFLCAERRGVEPLRIRFKAKKQISSASK